MAKPKYQNLDKLPQGFEYNKEKDEIYSLAGSNTESQLADIRTKFKAPNTQELYNKPQVFTDKTGKTTDKFGNPVGADGKPIVQAAPEKPLPETTPEALIDYKYQEQAKLGQEVFGKDYKAPTGFAEVVEDFKKSQAEDLDYFTKQQQIEQKLLEEETAKIRNAGEAAIEGTTAALAQGREGVMSSGTPKVIKEYATAIQADIGRAITRQEQAQAAYAQAKKDFLEAQDSGKTNLIQQRQAQLAGAEQELQAAKTEALNAQARSTELALKVNEQVYNQKITSLSTFQGIVESGSELSTEGLISMSDQLGLPFNTVYQYYTGAQKIRDDKKLTNEQQAAEIGLLNEKLKREIDGVVTAQAQDIEYYKKMVQSGAFANKEEQYAIARALGIEEYNDPFVQAELALKQAQIQAQYANTAESWQNVAMKQQELNELYGGGTYEFIPGDVTPSQLGGAGSNNILTYTGSYAGSSANNKGPDFSAPVGTPIKSHISGEVVSVISDGKYGPDSGWGNQIKIKDANGFIHQFSHLNPGSINVQVGMMVNPGQQIAQVGSTGHVMSGSGKNYSAAEAQAGKGSHLDYTVYDSSGKPVGLDKSVKFAFGESVPVAGVEQDGIYGKFYSQAIADGLNKEEAKKFAQTQYEDAYKAPTEAQSKAINAYTIMSNEEQNYQDLIDTVGSEKFADAIDFIARRTKDDDLLADVLNKYTLDPEVQQAIYSEMRWLEAALREESGAAISIGEYQTKGRAYFPRPGDSEATLKAKAQARAAAIQGKYNKIGPKAEILFAENGAGNSSEEDYVDSIDINDILLDQYLNNL